MKGKFGKGRDYEREKGKPVKRTQTYSDGAAYRMGRVTSKYIILEILAYASYG